MVRKIITQNKALMLLSIGIIVCSCSVLNKHAADLPQPPKDLNNNAPIVLPQIGNQKQPIISESAALMQHESQPSKFKKITEQRGPGGVVNSINVENPGKVPNYYINPNPPPASDTNNNPDKLSTPNWQWNW